MTTVNDLLRDKSTEIWTIAPESSVFEALELMSEKNIGAVLVLESGRLVGLLSERDYARKVILENRTSRDTPVRDVMTTRVAYVEPSMKIQDCLALMTDKRFRHLPVMANDKLVGLVSIGDLVKGVLAEKEFMIEQLEQYITGQ
ncbi:CBS domain-containing protein [Salinisphaera sp. SPP-AMP-43]|uniref:CBS domain-containing protein n=1 Tax=Salinisphaera sp. SPP-AMP-43 TaxID=3121288 RepID=UPI003C6DE317